jgi:hypothetical protein
MVLTKEIIKEVRFHWKLETIRNAREMNNLMINLHGMFEKQSHYRYFFYHDKTSTPFIIIIIIIII